MHTPVHVHTNARKHVQQRTHWHVHMDILEGFGWQLEQSNKDAKQLVSSSSGGTPPQWDIAQVYRPITTQAITIWAVAIQAVAIQAVAIRAVTI